MSEISGIDIPPDEMLDNNEKLKEAVSHTSKKEETKKETVNAAPVEDVTKSLNSIAALFSSTSGLGVFGSGN
jgi:hypothetical protein